MMDSSLVWEEMDMNAAALDFGQLFPEFTFDGKEVFSYVMQGELWEAVKALGNGITGAIEFQKGELRTLFLTILILGIVAALFSNFADLFKDHQVSDLAFYFVYLLLIAVLLFVILMSGYLIIYNIFYINVYHDIRYYGLLKTIGTTGRQLRRMVRRQAYMLSLYGIPAGVIVGTAVGKLLLPVVMGRLVFSRTTDTKVVLNVWVFAGAVIFSFVTVFISCIKPCRIASRVSPIEAVRYTEGQDESAGKKKAKKTKRVSPRTMAFQNIRRNRKKIVVVVASLSMALVMLNSIYSLLQGFDMDKFVASMTVSDFSVADATLDNFSIDYNSIVTTV